MKTIIILFFFFHNLCTHAQTDSLIMLPGRIENGDTILEIPLRAVYIVPPFVFENTKQKVVYSRLMENVKTVYPYSKIIRLELEKLDAQLRALPNDIARKKFIKEAEKNLRNEFEGKLTSLTVTQGRILLKLVDRETGRTTYELIKQLKGSFSAVFWQSIALIFGDDLKSEYDSIGEDKMIEDIIIRIENGQL